MQLHTVFDALQLAVSPVILISACLMLLLSMTNRLLTFIRNPHMNTTMSEMPSSSKNGLSAI